VSPLVKILIWPAAPQTSSPLPVQVMLQAPSGDFELMDGSMV
jgi:hypothetical protein